MATTPDISLQRLRTGDHGTFGVLRYPGGVLLSIECPWLDNIPSVSCIPDGQYEMRWTYSPRFKRKTYLIMDVSGRSGIRIHAGNLAGNRTKGLLTHFSGCIGFGVRTGVLSAQRAVLDSAVAVQRFERWARGRALSIAVGGAGWMS